MNTNKINYLVSINIPTYNQQKFILNAIESCLAQSYSNIEINILDDDSNDDTEILIRKTFSNSNIKYFKNTKNIGRVKNYKKGLKVSNGELVLNLDADDYFTNTKFIENAILEIDKINLDNFLFYQGSHIFKKGELEIINKPNINEDFIVIDSIQYLKNFFHYKHFSHMSTIYNKRKALSKGFYEKNIISTDIHSFLNMAAINKTDIIILSKSISGNWLQHENNISSSKNIKEHLKNFGLYFSIFKTLVKYNIFFAVRWIYTAACQYWGSYFKSLIV